MKKLLYFLLTTSILLQLVGCNNQDDGKKTKEDKEIIEEVSLTVDDYYDIVINTLKSDKIGIIEGVESDQNMVTAGSKSSYGGEIENGLANIDFAYIGENAVALATKLSMEIGGFDKEMPYNQELDIFNPIAFNENLDHTSGKPLVGNYENLGTIKVANLDKDLCEIENTTMICIDQNIGVSTDSEVTPHYKQTLDFNKTVYTFEFDEETNELIKYSTGTIIFTEFHASTAESVERFGRLDNDVVMMNEEEYTKLATDLMDYALSDGEMIYNDKNSKALLDFTVENFDLGFFSRYYYNNEEVTYQ